jgi:hypothetical protein
MANVVTRTRPGVPPKVKGEDDERSSDEREREVEEKDLVKERSPLADMLYLRCGLAVTLPEVSLTRQGWMG